MVVVIAGNVASSAAFDFTDGMREAIPVGFTLSIGAPRPFNLVGGGCQTPKKSIRKSRTVYLRGCDCAGNVFLGKGASGSESTVGQQSAAASDQRVLNKSSAVHCKVCPQPRANVPSFDSCGQTDDVDSNKTPPWLGLRVQPDRSVL